MDIEEVQRRVEEIRAAQHDDEAAHGLEDSLRADVLRSIAAGAPDAANLAAAALRSDGLDFARWGA